MRDHSLEAVQDRRTHPTQCPPAPDRLLELSVCRYVPADPAAMATHPVALLTQHLLTCPGEAPRCAMAGLRRIQLFALLSVTMREAKTAMTVFVRDVRLSACFLHNPQGSR